jgi:type IV secretory pathway VirB2 component (pilin)
VNTSEVLGIIDTALGILNYGGIAGVMFAGGQWMFGNRSEAVRRIVDVCLGLIVAHHAVEIIEWITGI